MTKQKQEGRWDALGLAISLGIAFLFLCALRLVGDSGSLINSQTALTAVLDEPIWHTRLARNIAFFAVAHLLLASLLGIVCWLMARLSAIAWPQARLTRAQWVFVWFIVASAWILIANATLYPWSLLGEPYAEFMKIRWLGIAPLGLATALIAALIAGTLLKAGYLLLVTGNPVRAQLRPGFVVSMIVVAVGSAGLFFSQHATTLARQPDRPNVIIVGVDSLRADAIFGGMGQELTPNIDGFLQQAVRFSDAVTPLARTFPSWVATLSGKYPHTTGAIVNLLPRDLIRTGDTLPEALRRNGFATAYAIDEVRFSNLDQSYGFDQMITPLIGASDFLLGTLNDTPLSNLAVNTALGKWLFPFSHGNRAAPITYDPDIFVKRIDKELRVDRKPMLLAVHLTLAHWPYYWATAPARELKDVNSLQQLYVAALRRADGQFAGVMEALRRKGMLENAVVVVMSDHGEAVGRENDDPYEDKESILTGLISAGHGTSVLSPQQYRVVLGFRSFGNSVVPTGLRRIDSPVSLVDLAPTVLDLLNLEVDSAEYDGRSLVPLMRNDPAAILAFQDRVRFTESEFNPRGIQPGVILTQSVLNEVASFYRLDPDTDRILMKENRVESLLQRRQYAAIRRNSLVAAVPADAAGGFRFLAAQRDGGVPVELDITRKDGGEVGALIEALQRQFGERLVQRKSAVPGG